MEDEDLEFREMADDISRGTPTGDDVIRHPIAKSKFIAGLKKSAGTSKSEAESLYKKLSDPRNKEKMHRLMANLKAAGAKGKKAVAAGKGEIAALKKELGIKGGETDWFGSGASKAKAGDEDWFFGKKMSKNTDWF